MEPSHKKAELPPIPAKRYFTIGEVSELCGVKPHVLRYWEQEFTQLKPVKRRGNRRYYQHHEVLLIRRIRELLYEEGFTISGARNRLDNGLAPDERVGPGASGGDPKRTGPRGADRPSAASVRGADPPRPSVALIRERSAAARSCRPFAPLVRQPWTASAIIWSGRRRRRQPGGERASEVAPRGPRGRGERRGGPR